MVLVGSVSLAYSLQYFIIWSHCVCVCARARVRVRARACVRVRACVFMPIRMT